LAWCLRVCGVVVIVRIRGRLVMSWLLRIFGCAGVVLARVSRCPEGPGNSTRCRVSSSSRIAGQLCPVCSAPDSGEVLLPPLDTPSPRRRRIAFPRGHPKGPRGRGRRG